MFVDWISILPCGILPLLPPYILIFPPIELPVPPSNVTGPPTEKPLPPRTATAPPTETLVLSPPILRFELLAFISLTNKPLLKIPLPLTSKVAVGLVVLIPTLLLEIFTNKSPPFTVKLFANVLAPLIVWFPVVNTKLLIPEMYPLGLLDE